MPQNAATRWLARNSSGCDSPRALINFEAAWAASHQAAWGAILATRCRMASRSDCDMASARLRHTTLRALQSDERLTQCAAGKYMLEAERLERVEEHDIQIAAETPMLISVV